MHALVIEDEYLIGMTLCGMLEALGFLSTDLAVNGSEAEQRFMRRRPDVISADHRLRHGESGIDVAHRLAAPHRLPVIYVTGSRVELTHLPQELIVSKPFSLHDLERALKAAGVL
jgi:CheY-like chemotaxis protein